MIGELSMSNIVRWPNQKTDPEPWGGHFPSGLEEAPAPRKWFVKDIIPQGELVLFTGAPGATKSRLALQMQISAALGLPWIGREIAELKCLGLYLEDGKDESDRRTYEICTAYGMKPADLDNRLELNPRELLSTKLIDTDRLRWSNFGEDFWRYIETDGYQLIVIDTATAALGWLGRRTGDYVNQLVRIFREKTAYYECSIVLIDHTPKSDPGSFAGVNSWLGALRAAMNIRTPRDKVSGEEAQAKRILRQLKSNYSSWPPIPLEWCNGILVPDGSDEAKESGVKLLGEITRDTDKAFLFFDGIREVWLPKSRVRWNQQEHTMTVPSWLARDKLLV